MKGELQLSKMQAVEGGRAVKTRGLAGSEDRPPASSPLNCPPSLCRTACLPSPQTRPLPSLRGNWGSPLISCSRPLTGGRLQRPA